MGTKFPPAQSGVILSQVVVGEDLRRGDFVAILAQSYQFPSFLWSHPDCELSPHELVNLKLFPPDAGTPLKIEGLSLPFVYAIEPSKLLLRTLDLRQTQLVRLAPRCAKRIWKRLRKGPTPENLFL